MDLANKQEITAEVGWPCPELCASGASRVRRPRFYWHVPMISERPGLFVGGKAPFLRSQLAGLLEPPDACVVPGWRWVSAHSEEARLPTFTRAIPRTRPPPAAPGLHNVSSTALSRYYADQLRFPPYTYADELCFAAEGCADPGLRCFRPSGSGVGTGDAHGFSPGAHLACRPRSHPW